MSGPAEGKQATEPQQPDIAPKKTRARTRTVQVTYGEAELIRKEIDDGTPLGKVLERTRHLFRVDQKL